MAEDHIALVDMDGTIADYDGEMQRQMEALYGPEETERHLGFEGPPHIERRRDLIKRQPGFWRNLPEVEHGMELVRMLRELGFSLHVLTKGPKSTHAAWSEKLEWCRVHIPDAFVTITEMKSIVYGRVLVDDYPPYFERWLAVRPRGLVVAVAQPWNEGVEHPQLVRFDGTNRDEVNERMRQAFVRVGGAP